MKKTSLLSLAALAAFMSAGAVDASAQTYMEPATLDYPAGLYASFPPSSVSVTYANQPIELIDPQTNDYGDDYVTVFVKLGEGEQQPVGASILYSFGDPENPDDPDLWLLDIALYELDDLWSFDGSTVTVILPEGIVKNQAGDINPSQQFVFEILPPATDYTVTPETGSTIDQDYILKVSFGGNPIEYLQSVISARIYEPEYLDIPLELGKEASISDDNELLIDLSGLASGEYEVVIPEGFLIVTVDGEKRLSPDIWLEYTVENNGGDSGVKVVEASSVNAVYTIDGRKVKTGSLTSLPAGIYISAGKKILVSE